MWHWQISTLLKLHIQRPETNYPLSIEVKHLAERRRADIHRGMCRRPAYHNCCHCCWHIFCPTFRTLSTIKLLLLKNIEWTYSTLCQKMCFFNLFWEHCVQNEIKVHEHSHTGADNSWIKIWWKPGPNSFEMFHFVCIRSTKLLRLGVGCQEMGWSLGKE